MSEPYEPNEADTDTAQMLASFLSHSINQTVGQWIRLVIKTNPDIDPHLMMSIFISAIGEVVARYFSASATNVASDDVAQSIIDSLGVAFKAHIAIAMDHKRATR